MTASEASAIIPAELSFLTIYNPSLALRDENLPDQIVYYTSKESRSKRRRKNGERVEEQVDREEENERLRQVGLAQGMVNFARNFSNGKAVDTIDTDKSRIVLHELETGWWILASISLTRLSSQASSKGEKKVEYSSREVAPAQLLKQQLIRANSIFLLHQAATLSDLYVRLSRDKFCALLDRFWTRFVRDWDVLLHGNPAVDIFNGTKLAAGGELGIGVGEEEWGSGEREVLEDFVARTEGLVDLVVSRFGDVPKQQSQEEKKTQKSPEKDQIPWLGSGNDPRPSDGVLFSGVGALSRRSLASVSQWMEWIYRDGQDAYGVSENPATTQRRRKRRTARNPRIASNPRSRKSPDPAHGQTADSIRKAAIMNQANSPGIPPPLVRAVDQSLEAATAQVEASKPTPDNSEGQQALEGTQSDTSAYGTDVMMKYLTLGYGSAWTLPTKAFQIRRRDVSGESQKDPTNEASGPEIDGHVEGEAKESESEPLREVDPTPEVSDDETQHFKQRLEESIGKFIIGLSGDLENEEDASSDVASNEGVVEESRIFLRTINIEMAEKIPALQPTNDPADDVSDESLNQHHKLQVAVYVHQPFIFTFLFALHTQSLSYPTFYRSIHHQLGPLQKPLMSSTDPTKVAQRIELAMNDSHSTTSPSGQSPTSLSQSIHDLVYDPRKLTVHTSIANIPDPGTLAAEGFIPSSSGSWLTLGIPTGSSYRSVSGSNSSSSTTTLSPWTRIDALNVHTQILNTYFATRSLRHEIERTSKTSRGWWVLWMRIPQGSHSETSSNDPREAFLVRQATDAASASGRERKVSSNKSWLTREREVSRSSNGITSAGGRGEGTGAVAEGIGVDARRWIEGLLALNR